MAKIEKKIMQDIPSAGRKKLRSCRQQQVALIQELVCVIVFVCMHASVSVTVVYIYLQTVRVL